MSTQFKFPDENGDEITVDTADAVEVDIVDDTPDKDKGRPALAHEVNDPSDEELGTYNDKVQKRIKELTHARHDERRAKESTLREKQELERVTQHLLNENRQLKQYVNVGEQQFAATANSAAELGMEAARRKLKEAHEAFDTDAIVAAQEALADAKMQLNSAKNFRPTPLQVENDVVQPPQVQQQQPQVDDKTLRWQAKNQWFGARGYEDMTSFSLGLHQKLVNSGVAPSADEYFEKIDSRMKATFPEFFGESGQPRNGDGTRRPTSVVAPGARSTGPRRIQLTSTQVALAKKFGLTPQQYAAEMLKMEKSNG